MKPRADKEPGLVLEGDDELVLVVDALEFAEGSLHQELNPGYADLIRRCLLLLDRLEQSPPPNSRSQDHLFTYREPEASYIMQALGVLSERSDDRQRAIRAGKMVRQFRRGGLRIVSND